MKNFRAALKKAVAKSAVKTAVKSNNSTCLWFQYQPKAPKALDKFKTLSD